DAFKPVDRHSVDDVDRTAEQGGDAGAVVGERLDRHGIVAGGGAVVVGVLLQHDFHVGREGLDDIMPDASGNAAVVEAGGREPVVVAAGFLIVGKGGIGRVLDDANIAQAADQVGVGRLGGYGHLALACVSHAGNGRNEA